MNVLKGILTGFIIFAIIVYVLLAVVLGIIWLAHAPSGWAHFWDAGWWLWIPLAIWPLAFIALVLWWFYELGDSFRKEVLNK